jgi:hypothetical protein
MKKNKRIERILKLQNNFKAKSPGVIFTALPLLRYLRMGLVSWSFCPWPAFSAYCYLTFKLIGPICKLRRK